MSGMMLPMWNANSTPPGFTPNVTDPSQAPGASRGLLTLIKEYLGGWLGPRLGASTNAGVQVAAEQVHSGPSMVVLPWFLPYFDDYTGETAQARAAYRRMFADPNVKSALLGKLLAVGALDLKIRPAQKKNALDEEVAEFVKWTLTERVRDGFPGMVWSILSGGLIDGYSVCEKVFEQEEGGEFDKLWPLVAVKPKDVGNDLVLQTDSYRNVVSVMGLRYNAGQYFSPARFLIWRHLPLYDTPTGMSDLRAVYSRYWLLDTVLKLRGVNAEKRAIPFLMGTYTNPTQQRSLESTLAQVKSQAWVTVPEGVKVEALNIAGSADSVFEGFIRDLKHDIFMGIQGAILQALEGSVTDGRGNSQVHRSTADLLVWYLAQSLQTLLNDRTNGLIKDIVDLNYVVNRYPRATLSAVDVGEMTAELDIDTKLHGMGVELSKEDMYERYNRVPPLSPEDALKKDAGGMPGMPGPGGPGGGGLPPGGPPGLGEGDPMGGDADLDGGEVDDDGLFDEQDLFTAPMRRFAEWEESKHPRGKGGRFGRGSSGAQAKKKAKRNAARREAGGGSVDHTSGPSPRKSLLRVAGSQVMSTIRKAKHKVEDVEHVVADYLAHGVDRQIERLPAGVRQSAAATWWVTKLGTKAAFVTYTTGQKLAEEVAKESGATPEQAARIKAICTAVDIAGAKAVPVTLGAVGLGAMALPGSFLPAGSAAYLAYSTARRPLAVLRAARTVVKGMAEAVLSKFGEEGEGVDVKDARRLAESVVEAGDRGDWYAALVCAALDEVDTLEEALDIADEAMGDVGDDDAEDAEEFDEGGAPDEDTVTLALIYLAAELKKGTISQEQYDAAVEKLGPGPEEFAEEDWDNIPGPRSKNRWVHKTSKRVVYSATNPGKSKRKPAGEKGPARPEAKKVTPPVEDYAARKARWDALDADVKNRLGSRLVASGGGGTPSQVQYRRDLLRGEFANIGQGAVDKFNDPRLISKLFLAERVPTPADKADASRQIDALKGGGVLAYARTSPEWAREQLAALAAVAGPQGEKLPELFKSRYASLSDDEKMVAQRSNQNYYELVVRPSLQGGPEAKEKPPAKPKAPAKGKAQAPSLDDARNALAAGGDADSLAGTLGGLAMADLQTLKKEWKLKVGGTKVDQAKALARQVLGAGGQAKPELAADAGPREGDRNADGLTFRDGRWRLVGGQAAARAKNDKPAVGEKPTPAPAQPSRAEMMLAANDFIQPIDALGSDGIVAANREQMDAIQELTDRYRNKMVDEYGKTDGAAIRREYVGAMKKMAANWAKPEPAKQEATPTQTAGSQPSAPAPAPRPAPKAKAAKPTPPPTATTPTPAAKATGGSLRPSWAPDDYRAPEGTAKVSPKAESAALQHISEFKQQNPLNNISFDVLYKKLNAEHPMSPEQFKTLMLDLYARGDIKLHPFTRPKHEMPDPTLAAQRDWEDKYYAQPVIKKGTGFAEGDWDESKHPRAEDGKFGSGGGGGKSSASDEVRAAARAARKAERKERGETREQEKARRTQEREKRAKAGEAKAAVTAHVDAIGDMANGMGNLAWKSKAVDKVHGLLFEAAGEDVGEGMDARPKGLADRAKDFRVLHAAATAALDAYKRPKPGSDAAEDYDKLTAFLAEVQLGARKGLELVQAARGGSEKGRGPLEDSSSQPASKPAPAASADTLPPEWKDKLSALASKNGLDFATLDQTIADLTAQVASAKGPARKKLETTLKTARGIAHDRDALRKQHASYAEGQWDESKHPRAADGKFGKGSGGGKKEDTKKKTSTDPGDRPFRPVKWKGDDGIAAHAKKMVKAHEADPHIQKLNASLQESTAKLAELEKARKDTRTLDEWKQASEGVLKEEERVGKIKEALAHEARRSVRISFGVPIGSIAKLDSYTKSSTSAQAKSWEKAKEFLRVLTSQDGVGDQMVTLEPTRSRAFYKMGTIYTTKDDGPVVSAHEFGHHLERYPWVQERVQAFRESRFDPGQDVDMRKQFPTHSYAKGEVGNSDDMGKLFDSESEAAYVGKTYPGGMTEIVSMGIQQLYADPVKFARVDPEYFSLIIGILQRGPA